MDSEQSILFDFYSNYKFLPKLFLHLKIFLIIPNVCCPDLLRRESCLHKEFTLLKTIFRIKSDKDEIQRFMDEKQRIKENDKAILKKSLGNVFKNKSLLDKIPQEKKVLIVKHFNLGKIN